MNEEYDQASLCLLEHQLWDWKILVELQVELVDPISTEDHNHLQSIHDFECQ